MDYNGKYSWRDLLNINYDRVDIDKQAMGNDDNQINSLFFVEN